MTNPEASGGADDLTSIISDVIQTMGGASRGEAANPGIIAGGEVNPPNVGHGANVTVAPYLDGVARPVRIEFCMFGDDDNHTASPELGALWLAIDAYADLARNKREQQRDMRISNFSHFVAYVNEARALATEADKLEERSIALSTLVDSLNPDTKRPDGLRGMVSIDGADAAVVYDAMMLGIKKLAERDSNGDPEAYEAILSQRTEAIAYTNLAVPVEDSTR